MEVDGKPATTSSPTHVAGGCAIKMGSSAFPMGRSLKPHCSSSAVRRANLAVGEYHRRPSSHPRQWGDSSTPAKRATDFWPSAALRLRRLNDPRHVKRAGRTGTRHPRPQLLYKTSSRSTPPSPRTTASSARFGQSQWAMSSAITPALASRRLRAAAGSRGIGLRFRRTKSNSFYSD